MMNVTQRVSRTLTLVLSLGLMSACDNALETQAQEPDQLQGLGPGIHPVVVLANQTGSSARVEVRLKKVEVPGTIASYQGELGFDTQGLTLVGAELPQGVMGAWNETRPGVVRFAGAAMNGIGDGPVLVLRFTAKGTVKADAFTIRMEEVVASNDFTNLTAKVIAREHPLFSNTPLE
jgi:hypothetical protein